MTSQQQLQAQALQQLAIIGGQLTKDDDIRFEGNSFVFPDKFNGDMMGAANEVYRLAQSMAEPISVSKTFEYRPNDGAYATKKMLIEFFGYALSKATPGMHGDIPPEERTIDLGWDNGVLVRETVPWGDMVLPGLPNGTLRLMAKRSPRGDLFHLEATVRRMDQRKIDGFFICVESYLKEHSIYRGKCMDGGMNFLDVDRIRPEDFVYSEDVWADAAINFLSPLKDADEIRRNGLNQKRVTLLEGPFGTGKTSLLRTAAKTAVANGVTVIMCRPEDNPLDVLQTALLYAGSTGSLMTAEDIDVLAAQRDPMLVSKMLDVFDGAQTKNIPLIGVLTTNHVGDIHKGLLRSGRIDAVMTIGAMDRPGVEKLGKLTLREHCPDDIVWDDVFDSTSGFMPAYVKEGFERALRYPISRTGKAGTVVTADIVRAMKSLRAQHDIQEAASDRAPALEPMDAIMRSIVQERVDELNERIGEQLDEVRANIESNVDSIIEHRVNGSRITLEDANGDSVEGSLYTN